ncbi:unnamed protein product [Onchocerca ochengi]|uniref:DUF148 domain-containing protein n=1 Tax=Onchocerca ochengi TaxID=42157 RepID=A0A182DZQ6_ONCOC|nr:unnamed protein product [Onchocerca ochengi]
MITANINFPLVFLSLLLFISVSKSYAELNYDIHRYDVRQQSNIPFSTPNIKMRPGFRLKTGITDHQRAELSWLATNTEPNRQSFGKAPRAQPLFHLRTTTKQPQVSSTNHINYQQHFPQRQISSTDTNYQQRYLQPEVSSTNHISHHQYYQQSQISPTNYINYQYPYYHYYTLPPIYYASNFRTIPPAYHNNYIPPALIQPTHVPLSTMMSAIRGILSIVQKTMNPNSTDDMDFHTIRNNIPKESNLNNSSKQLPQKQSSLLSSSSSSSSPSSPLSTPSSLALLSATLEKIGVASISGNDNDDDNDDKREQLVNVEQMKGTAIQKVKEILKSIELTSHGISEIDNSNTENIATSITTTTTTTATTTTKAIRTGTTTIKSTTTTQPIDDGSNLLGSLLSGRLDKVDWFGSLFGMNNLPTKEEGSAMAQIFQGGIFGPAS